MAVKPPPAPVTARRKTWSCASPVTGAVNDARAAFASASVPPVSDGRVQARVTFVPQGSSPPASAPSTPSRTVPPETAPSPPAGAAAATGAKPALPGLSARSSAVRPVRCSNTRAGRYESALSERSSSVSVASSPAKVPGSSPVSVLPERSSLAIPPSPAKSPGASTATPSPARSSVPASAPRCASVTCAQFATVESFAVTRASSSARTCAVRPQMPSDTEPERSTTRNTCDRP